MEDENTVTYFLFNDRKGTSRCSFILVVLVLSLNCILVLLTFCPFSTPNTALSYFVCPPFSFPNHLHSPLVYLLFNPNQNSFSTPPQSLCNKGMATLSFNSYDIAPQKQCNYHLKALLLERKSYSFAPQRLCPRQTGA